MLDSAMGLGLIDFDWEEVERGRKSYGALGKEGNGKSQSNH